LKRRLQKATHSFELINSPWIRRRIAKDRSITMVEAIPTVEDEMPSMAEMSPKSRIGLKMQSTPATVASTMSHNLSMCSPTDVSFNTEGQHRHFVRLPMPTPSRPRLHPRYAARLSNHNLTAPTAHDEQDVMLPPLVNRNHTTGIFRPALIISVTHRAGDESPLDVSLEETDPKAYNSKFFSSTLSRPNERLGSNQRVIDETCLDTGVSDRFIPSRATSSFNFNLWDGPSDDAKPEDTADATASTDVDQDDVVEAASYPSTTGAPSQQTLLNTLLRSELLGENDVPMSHHTSSQSRLSLSAQPFREGMNKLRYQSPRQVYQENLFEETLGLGAIVNSFSLMPVGSAAGQRLMSTPTKRKRRIAKVPFKVLDAPALQDDFYLNLVDWSSQNVLAVGLGSCVYLWSACTSKVTKLCDLAASEDLVTSVSWAQRGTHLAVGTNRGEVQLWDTVKIKQLRVMAGHTARVGTLAWTGPILASGSRDRLIYLRDVRVQSPFTEKLTNHKQEVCGLKWSADEPSFLASGGNDNNLHVIDSRNPCIPIHQFTDHTAAVKAIAWSPHQHGLLASGGGTADRNIRFWNTLSGASLNKIDTGSQVCNLAWSKNCNEIVSTHGYSLNQIVVWRYPSMSKVATLTGHTFRVLYLSMSPDGSTIVTGAGDETLRFWQVFPGPRSNGKESTGGLLFPKTLGSVIR
jgi:cell division cycle 20-like protein 1 (cofactor of APC complex)